MVGNVELYKGVREFVEASLTLLSAHSSVWVLVVGRCRDEVLADWLHQASSSHERLIVDLRFVPEAELAPMLRVLDVMALPFRSITTSSSAVAALNAARPVLVPGGAPLEDLPDGAVHRYAALEQGLEWAMSASPAELDRMSRVAQAWSIEWSWADAAEATVRIYERVLAPLEAAE